MVPIPRDPPADEPGPSSAPAGVTVVIPAFDEELAIAETVRGVRRAMEGVPYPVQVLVVDDGSRDRTAELARREGATVISLDENHGYGAALKAGIARARHDTVAILDADGTYPSEALPGMIAGLDGHEMVVGARVEGEVAIPRVRQPAKWFLQRLASYVTNRRIPDLNSGMRVMRRDLVRRFEHLLPSGFSFTTTITLAALSTDTLVRFHPISYSARVGDSKIRSRHAFDFLLLILRMAVYFNPLRVFLPLGALFLFAGAVRLGLDVSSGTLSRTTAFLVLAAGVLWGVGLLSDQLARVALRRSGPP